MIIDPFVFLRYPVGPLTREQAYKTLLNVFRDQGRIPFFWRPPAAGTRGSDADTIPPMDDRSRKLARGSLSEGQMHWLPRVLASRHILDLTLPPFLTPMQSP